MTYFKHIKIVALLAGFLLVSACDNKFDETNINPNNPEKATPDLLLTTVVRQTATRYFNENWSIGNVVADQTTNQFQSSFDWSPDRSDLWSVYYNQLRNVYDMIRIAEQNKQHNYQGIGLILKSWMFQLLTDTYGEIPCSQALQGKDNNNFSPAYDSQEAVYTTILSDLETAHALLGTSNEQVQGDILYGGSLINWKRFANALRIRVLMRMSDRKNPSVDLQRILSNPQQFPLFTSNDQQAALQYLDTYPNEYPLYYLRSGTFQEFHLSTTLEHKLKELNDIRLSVFAQPTAASANQGMPVYAGVPNGVGSSVESGYNGGADNQSLLGLLWAGKENSALASPNAAQSIILSYAELLFTLAEAAEQGYISGDASSYYYKGIEASFTYWKSRIPRNYTLPDASLIVADNTYLQQDAVAYTGSKEEKLTKIGVQKWIANFFNGLEAWSDWRRTGIPDLQAGPASSNNGTIPVRYLYPYSEQALNRKNYNDVVTRQPDALSTHVWWDVK